MKKAFAIILALTIMLASTVGASAQAAQPVTSVTVSSGLYGGKDNSLVYTDPRQIALLLSFLPTGGKPAAVSPTEAPGGGVAAIVSFTRNGKGEEWVFYSDRYRRTAPTIMQNWNASTEAVYDTLLQLSGLDAETRIFTRSTQVYYKGEKVTALYSLDGKDYSYQPVTDLARIVPMLEKRPPDNSRNAAELGFLLFTEKGKYTWSLSDDSVYAVLPLGEPASPQRTAWTGAVNSATDLATLSALYNDGLYGRRAQWLTYMSEEKIEAIYFSAWGGRNYTNSGSLGNFGIGVNTSDKESIRRIAAFLKGLDVPENPRVTNLNGIDYGMSTVAGLYDLRIKFNTGAIYHIFGYDSGMSIVSSELNKMMHYEVSQRQINALRDFLAMLPDTQLTPFSAS